MAEKDDIKLIDIKSLTMERKPDLMAGIPRDFRDHVFNFLEKLLRLDDINDLMIRFKDLQGIDFVKAFVSDVDLDIRIAPGSLKNIPAEGRFIAISNHPLGGLDGMALLNAVAEVRDDVKFIVNDVLNRVVNLRKIIIPFSRTSISTQARSARNMINTLKKGGGLMFFPAGGVSRVRTDGIRDPKWMEGAFYFAQKFNCPIVPMFVDAKNSLFYYICTMLHKNLAALMLPREIFRKKSKKVNIKIGGLVEPELIRGIPPGKLAKAFKEYVYKMGRAGSDIKELPFRPESVT